MLCVSKTHLMVYLYKLLFMRCTMQVTFFNVIRNLPLETIRIIRKETRELTPEEERTIASTPLLDLARRLFLTESPAVPVDVHGDEIPHHSV
jgi:hypothetical protein